jgi:hypothetical protein
MKTKIEAVRTIERIPASPGRVGERASWPPGEWDSEPDLVEWRDEATGYPCLIVRGPVGSLCGYVGVPPEHPCHGKPYGEVDGQVNAHGGLTFSNSCQEGGDICHVPLPGEPAEVWWFGFDCAHSGDVSPGLLAIRRKMGEDHPELADFERSGMWRETYKTIAYVQGEATTLAAELKLLA